MIITDCIIKKMEQYKIITDDIEIYTYGLNNGFTLIINLLTAIIISIILKKTDLLFFLIISFIPLRSYSGGFHCKSRLSCYICSSMLISFLLIIQFILCKIFIVFSAISFVCFIFLYIRQTKGSTIRALELEEIIQFTKIKRIILLSILFSSILLTITDNKLYATTLMSSITCVTILLFIEKVNCFISKT